MTRTFIALDLNEAIQRFLGGIISQVSHELPDLRWVDPGGIHLTLAFLGELSDESLDEAMHAAEEAAQKATQFEYHLKGLGIFGSPQQPRVIWMGVEDLPSGKVQGSPLQHVHRVLAKELEMRDFEVEKRPFSPHLTLARNKQPLTPDAQQRLQRLLHSRLAGSSSAFYPVNSLYVMKSELSRSGAKYTCLKECFFSTSISS
ncbi:MAG TPA: RNA 2',3'-cyclic phosphodiesterase [Ktedonobacteraceae bacterium]|nr:RNA 2',3'-cyclic phosphodiesterase [Ktedonobacteraceae bacterium]HXZ05292.1 RNA 2',3'-cyclic phosphodiesterase [Ktedonobacteraceae bacterium]